MKQAHASLSPAYLWLGSADTLHAKAVDFLQGIFCTSSCGSCNTCIKVRTQQHHAIVWLAPEKQYTLEQLNVIFSTISFSLDAGEQFFFVLQHADFLTPVCANALLKSLEEPPPGYHFLLLAQRQERILPTIRSRCIIENYAHAAIDEYDQLLRHFKKVTAANPQQFLTDLEKIKPNERTSIELLDALLGFWTESFKQLCSADNTKAQKSCLKTLNAIRIAYERPPMPGSAKLFWKDLFLQLQTI